MAERADDATSNKAPADDGRGILSDSKSESELSQLPASLDFPSHSDGEGDEEDEPHNARHSPIPNADDLATDFPDNDDESPSKAEAPQRAHSPSPELPSPSKHGADSDLATRSTKRSKHDRSRHTHKTESLAEDDEHELARKEALKALTEIEQDFAKFREKMYQEKMAEVEAEVAAVLNGNHPLLVSQMVEIEQRRDDRLAAGSARLRQEELSIQRQFEAAVTQANTDFVCRRGEERRRMLNEMDLKRWRMSDEKRRLDEAEMRKKEAEEEGLKILAIPDPVAYTERRAMLKNDIKEWRAVFASGGFPSSNVAPCTRKEVEDDFVKIGLRPTRVATAAGRTRRPARPRFEQPAATPLPPLAGHHHDTNHEYWRGTPDIHHYPMHAAPMTGHHYMQHYHDHEPPPPPPPPPLAPPQQHWPYLAHQHHMLGHPPLPTHPHDIAGGSMGSGGGMRGMWIDGDVLHYGGSTYARDDRAYLVDSKSKLAVKVLAVSKSDLTVQRSDGSRTKIFLDMLEDGRQQLQPRA
ncbi:Transcriptional regulatory protein [Geranomyces michiganensis]|nr:Transcriptional regulatory protein [Geranomyces michiganensis]